MWHKETPPSLSLQSSLEEVLRFLFGSSLAHVFLYGKKNRFFLTKEELITFIESETPLLQIGDILHMPEREKSGKKLMETLPPFQKILLLTDEGGRIARVIDITSEREIFLPPWWEAPFPLVALQDEEISLNQHAYKLCKGGTDVLQKALANFSGEEEEYIFSCSFPWGEERRFFAKKMEDRIFSLEDISSEMHMAEDIVWWAAVGNALATYLQAKGVGFRCFHERDSLPEQKGHGETIPCRWEGDLLGYIKLSFEENLSGGDEGYEGKTCGGSPL
jgi:hypothetical protein